MRLQDLKSKPPDTPPGFPLLLPAVFPPDAPLNHLRHPQPPGAAPSDLWQTGESLPDLFRRILTVMKLSGQKIGIGAEVHVTVPAHHIGIIVRDLQLLFGPQSDYGLMKTDMVERRTPLPGAGFGRDPFYSGLLVVIGPGDGRIRFMTSRRTDAFIFIIDLRRSAERSLQIVGAIEGRRTPEGVFLQDRFGDIDPSLGRYLLFNERINRSGPIIRSETIIRTDLSSRSEIIIHFHHRFSTAQGEAGKLIGLPDATIIRL